MGKAQDKVGKMRKKNKEEDSLSGKKDGRR